MRTGGLRKVLDRRVKEDFPQAGPRRTGVPPLRPMLATCTVSSGIEDGDRMTSTNGEPAAPHQPARHFRVPPTAWLATGVSLGGWTLCCVYQTSSPALVALGLVLAFAAFLGLSLAMILASDR